MSLDILESKDTSLDQEVLQEGLAWRDLVQVPDGKRDDDVDVQVRVVPMNGIEFEALRFSHSGARTKSHIHVIHAALAQVRRAEQHQQPPHRLDQPARINHRCRTIRFEEVASKGTSTVAQREPEPWPNHSWRLRARGER